RSWEDDARPGRAVHTSSRTREQATEGRARSAWFPKRLSLTGVTALRGTDVVLTWTRDPEGRVVQLLSVMRDPAGKAAEREQHGEHVGREAHGPVDDPGEEVDVRVELAVGEVGVFQRGGLELERQFEELFRVVVPVEDLAGQLLDLLAARVEVLVDPVAEAHEADLTVLHALQVVLDADARAPNVLEHLQHGLVGPTV